MKDLNQMSLCQTLWARNKYLVLSHSSNIYLEIRQYLKSESVEVAHVQALIEQAVSLPENRGQVCNAFQHIWGYLRRKPAQLKKIILCYSCFITNPVWLIRKIWLWL